MAGRRVGRRKRSRRKNGLKRSVRDRRSHDQRIGLDARGVLALGQVRAGRAPVVIVEEVVDEMRGKADQVGGKEARRQDARYSEVKHFRGFYPQLALMATRHDLPSRVMATIVTFGGTPFSVKRMTSPAWSPA